MSRDKQIEEMDEDLRYCHTEFGDDLDIYTDYRKTAEKLVAMGYRKVKTNNWLTKGISAEQLEREKQEALDEFAKQNGYRRVSHRTDCKGDEGEAMKPWEEEIYQWGKGNDAEGDDVMIALNSIIRGLYTLSSIADNLEGLGDPLNVSSDYQLLLGEIDKRIDYDLGDLAMEFEVARTLLVGSKINYPFLVDHLHKWGEERKRNDQSRMESGN